MEKQYSNIPDLNHYEKLSNNRSIIVVHVYMSTFVHVYVCICVHEYMSTFVHSSIYSSYKNELSGNWTFGRDHYLLFGNQK